MYTMISVSISYTCCYTITIPLLTALMASSKSRPAATLTISCALSFILILRNLWSLHLSKLAQIALEPAVTQGESHPSHYTFVITSLSRVLLMMIN